MDAYKRNRYLDAMGVDVWVRRPGGALDGVWVDPPASVGVSGEGVVQDAAVVAHDVAPAESTPVEISAALEVAPAAARASAEPVSGDEAARWEALRTEVLTCTRCPLHKTRTQGVVGVGPHRTDWMVIGEAPGAEEDRRGEPFVGRAGHLDRKSVV